MPIIVDQQVGKGRVMVSAIDCTWQWRTYVGGYTGESSFYDKFWGQVVRYLGGETTDDSTGELHVSMDRAAYAPGDDVSVLVSMGSDEQGGETGVAAIDDANWHISALATHEDGAIESLKVVGVGEDRFRALLKADRPGKWFVQVRAEPRIRTRDKRQTRIITVPVMEEDPEAADVRPDNRWLERVAQTTGGQVIPVEDLSKWKLDNEPVIVEATVDTGLWHHPAWISAILLLLCAEWVLRRLGRLA
jgi:hypothetical protein